MFKQPRLIIGIDADFAEAQGKKESRVYERLCGKLRLEDIFTTDSVYICATRCASGFYNKADTQAFMKRPWENAYMLCEQVLSGKFHPTYYRTHEINERGKKRTIKPPTFTCKVVQKVLCDYLIRPLLEPKMISTSYASLQWRGTTKMHEDICQALNRAIMRGTDFSIILFDYKNYFGSIDVEILMEQLSRYISDGRILGLFRSFCPDEIGLSLGNEVSQIPASWFPSEIDHFFKDCLRLPIFRYMDDTLLVCENGKEEQMIGLFQRQSEKLHLSCPDEKIHVYRSKENFRFCKELFVWDAEGGHYDHILNQQIPQHEMRKINHFEEVDEVPANEEEVTKRNAQQEKTTQQIKGVMGSIASHPHSKQAMKKLEEGRGKVVKKWEANTKAYNETHKDEKEDGVDSSSLQIINQK